MSVYRRGLGGKEVKQDITWGNPAKFPLDPNRPQGDIGRAAAERVLAKQTTAAGLISAYARADSEVVARSIEQLRNQGLAVENLPEFTDAAEITPMGRAVFAIDYVLEAGTVGMSEAGKMTFQVGVLERLAQIDPELLEELQATFIAPLPTE